MTKSLDLHAIASDRASTYPTSNFYLLLDSAGLHGLHRKLSESRIQWTSLFGGTAEKNALAISPVLVLAGSDGTALLSRSLARWIEMHGRFNSTIIAISSSLKAEAMKERLVARLHVKLTENMDALLRFFDPRILESLEANLTTEQAHSFFSIGELWTFIDRVGEVRHFSTVFDPVERLPSGLALSEEQEFSLIQASEIDQVISLLRKNLPVSTGKMGVKKFHELVSHALDAAKKDGIESVLDLATYAGLILTNGEAIVGEQSWKELIKAWKKSNQAFYDFASDYELAEIFSIN